MDPRPHTECSAPGRQRLLYVTSTRPLRGPKPEAGTERTSAPNYVNTSSVQHTHCRREKGQEGNSLDLTKGHLPEESRTVPQPHADRDT